MITFKETSDAAVWNEFLLSLSPNTFLQSWQWGEVQRKLGQPVHRFEIYNAEKKIGVAQIIVIQARRGTHLLIPHGPILTHESFVPGVLSELIDVLKLLAKRYQACAARLAPLWLDTPALHQQIRSLGFRPSPMHVHAERTWVVPIEKEEDKILLSMRKTTRQAITRAQKTGVTVEITTNPKSIDRFYPLYQETRDRHDFVPYSKSLIENQVSQFNRSSSRDVAAYFAFARYQNRDVAAGVFFQFGPTVFYYHGASVKLPSKISATQLLQWESIREARRRGATRYNLWGIAPTGAPRHPFAGITIFKQGFGGGALNYIRAHDLPLDWRYWQLWAVDMIRKYRRGF